MLQGRTLRESQVQTAEEVLVITRDRAPPVFLSVGEDAGVRAINTHLSLLGSVSPVLPPPPSSKESNLEEQLRYEQMTLAACVSAEGRAKRNTFHSI